MPAPPVDHVLPVTWTDLVDVAAGDRVVLVGHGRAAAALRARGAEVGGPEAAAPAVDLVCVDGCRLSAAERRRLRGLLAEHGRWVQVSDNLLSPLRLADVVRRRPRGGDARLGLGGLVRGLRRDGLDVGQVFALLRSTQAPVTAFDTTSALGTAATLSATLTHVGGARGLLLRLLGRSHPGFAARLAPGWLVVAGGRRRAADPPVIVGKVANRDSTEVKILRGDPPAEVERHHLVDAPVTEAAALRSLEEVGFTEAPRLLGISGASARYSWLRGHSLVVDRLDDDDLVAWTARAAALLARLQELTGEADGSVLVHGDFWLGNLLVEGDRVTGLVDWGDARRGSPDVDRRFLVESLERRQRVAPALRDRLEEVCAEALPGPPPGPPPPVALLGTLDGPPPRIAQAPRVVALGDASAPEVEAWLAGQPVPPVLLPVSASGLALVSHHRDRWPARVLLPPTDVVEGLVEHGAAGLLSGHGIPVVGSAGELLLQAFVDAAGVLVGAHLLTPDGAVEQVGGALHPELHGLARRVVASLGLRGALALHVGRGTDGGWAVAGLASWLTSGHVTAAATGADVGSCWYADAAGLVRPRSVFDDADGRALRGPRGRRPGRAGGRATSPTAGRGGSATATGRGAGPSSSGAAGTRRRWRRPGR